MKKILFLGYNSKKTKLINFLRSQNFKLTITNKKLSERKDLSVYDLIISFGYNHIISKNL